MGARQSGTTRSVSMENNSPIIDVSDAVAQRLKDGLKAGNRVEDSKPVSKGISTQTQEKTIQSSPAAKKLEPQSAKPSVPSSYTNPLPYPPGIIYGEPTITAMEIQRLKEIELHKNDAYWRKKMSDLEQTLNKTNQIMEQEYTAAFESVKNKFQHAAPIHQLPPCQDLKSQLIACYRANHGESLKCAEEVTAFTNCVSQNRLCKIDEPQDKKRQSLGKK